MNKKVLVVGNGEKWHIKEKLIAMGYEPIFVLYSKPLSFEHDYIVITPEQALTNTYDIELFAPYAKESIQGLIVCSELYVEIASTIKAKYFPDLEYLDTTQIESLRDKLKLKELLNSYNIQTVKYSELSDRSSFNELKQELQLPFLIKPRKGVLAQDICIISNLADWRYWLKSKSRLLDTYYAEEYLINIKEYCCDALVVNNNITAIFPGEYSVDCLSSNHLHCGIGVNYPGFLPSDQIEILKSITTKFVKLHKIRNAFCHIEFFFHNGHWKFGEIGCRPAGGLQMPAESQIINTDLVDQYIKIFLKSEFANPSTYKIIRPYVGYYLYPKIPGTVKKIRAKTDYPWLLDSNLYVNEGQVIDFEDSSVSMAASVIYEANSVEQLKERSLLAQNMINIEMSY